MNAQNVTASSKNDRVEARHRRSKAPGLALATLTVIWLGVVGIGLSRMWAYEATPAEVVKSPAHWPADTRIARDTDRPTLVVFAHPRCPCTRASIGELALIMAHNPGRVDAHVLFFRPSGFSAEWEKTDLWFSAEAIPGVKVVLDIEKKARELSEASRYKSEFLANMSHEIRTPMTAILGFTDLVLENVRDPQNVDGLQTIRKNGQYLLALINNILDLSKIESGKLEVEHIKCSPARILEDVASLMRIRSAAKGLALEIEYDGPIPQTIHSDPTRLRQILINLTGNAIKFSEIGTVRLVARLLDEDSDAPKMQFDVVDMGIGMTAEQIGKLFQPFAQADASMTRKFGGTGLGLAISKRLAKMLGGDISIHSIPGEGSTFSLTVAVGTLEGVTITDDPTECETHTAPAAKPTGGDVRLDCRVLIAEDGPDNQRLLTFILEKAGAAVTVAQNGQIALDKVHDAGLTGESFDVILMDMQMPVLDGYSASHQLRQNGYAGPILALTAHAMSADRQKCLDAGCDDYLTKPIDRNKLVEAVASHAKTSATVPEATTLEATSVDS